MCMQSEFFLKLNQLIKGNFVLYFFVLYLLTFGCTWYFFSTKKTQKVEADSTEEIQILTETKSHYAEIAGAVVNPGVYEIEQGARVSDLLTASGGFIEDADSGWVMKNLNLAATVGDTQKVYIPYIWDIDIPSSTHFLTYTFNQPPTQDQSPNVDEEADEAEPDNSSNGGLINVNTASLEELDTLEGIGKVYAQKIIDNRPYKDFEEFKTKSALSETLVIKLKAEVTY